MTPQMPDDFDRAVALQRDGRLPEAASLCETILGTEPDHPRALHMLGALRFTSGAQKDGIRLVTRAVQVQPDYAEAHFNLGAMLMTLGRREPAADHYTRAAALRPDNAEAHRRLGAILMDLARLADAEAAFRRLVALKPDDVSAVVDLSTLALALGRPDDAVEQGRRAVVLAPDNAVAKLRLGRGLKERGDFGEAIALYRQALTLDPASAMGGNFLAVALYEQGDLDDAEATCRRVLAAHPEEPAALYNLGLVLQANGDSAEALRLLRRAVVLDPGRLEWQRAILTSSLYAPDIGTDALYEINAAFGRAAEQPGAAGRVFANSRDPQRKLRVGWLSSDLRGHPVGRNLQMFVANRDRQQFEYVFYTDVRRPDEVTDWFRERADGWRPIAGLNDEAVAEMIRADGIDVMMYLAGRFDMNRPQVAAYRAAPVQVSLFDAATSGLREMDYLISDPLMIPAHRVERFIERPLRLPNFYVHPPIDEAPGVAPVPCVSSGHITFGCFNNPSKINDRVLDLWARVLAAVPRSRLVLKYTKLFESSALRARVQRAMAAHGVSADRLEMGGSKEPIERHLANYGRVDIALDPFPFTGSTATFEALWMGVPVVTLNGDHMMARWSASLLTKVGLAELVAETADAYVEKAVRLAADRQRLSELRDGLRSRVATSVLCNGPRTTRYLERSLRAAWRRWCAS